MDKNKFKIGTSILPVTIGNNISKNLSGSLEMRRSCKNKNSLYRLFINKLRLNYDSYRKYYYDVYRDDVINLIFENNDLFDGILIISLNNCTRSVTINYNKDLYHHDYILKLVSKLLFPRRTYKF